MTLLGHVVEAGSGRPVGRALVEARLGGAFVETNTDDTGAFRLEGMSPGSRVVLWARSEENAFVAETMDVALPQGRTTVDAGVMRVLAGDEFAGDLGGWLGMFAGLRGNGTVVVRAVNPWLPAERAGILIGDRLWSINGRDLADLGVRAISYLLRGPVGSAVTLVVQTGASPPRTLILHRVVR